MNINNIGKKIKKKLCGFYFEKVIASLIVGSIFLFGNVLWIIMMSWAQSKEYYRYYVLLILYSYIQMLITFLILLNNYILIYYLLYFVYVVLILVSGLNFLNVFSQICLLNYGVKYFLLKILVMILFILIFQLINWLTYNNNEKNNFLVFWHVLLIVIFFNSFCKLPVCYLLNINVNNDIKLFRIISKLFSLEFFSSLIFLILIYLADNVKCSNKYKNKKNNEKCLQKQYNVFIKRIETNILLNFPGKNYTIIINGWRMILLN